MTLSVLSPRPDPNCLFAINCFSGPEKEAAQSNFLFPSCRAGSPNPLRSCATPGKPVAHCAITPGSLRNGTHDFQIIARRLVPDCATVRSIIFSLFETIIAFHRSDRY